MVNKDFNVKFKILASKQTQEQRVGSIATINLIINILMSHLFSEYD